MSFILLLTGVLFYGLDRVYRSRRLPQRVRVAVRSRRHPVSR